MTPCQYFQLYFYVIIVIIIQNNMSSQAHINSFMTSWEADENNACK